jgi:hypothetical protein
MITTKLAEKFLGIKLDNAYLQSKGSVLMNGEARTTMYRYPFSSMTFEGISVGNPDVTIVEDDGFKQKSDTMVIGASILRQLHVYIAYKEKILYVSPAEEPPTPMATPQPQSAAAH